MLEHTLPLKAPFRAPLRVAFLNGASFTGGLAGSIAVLMKLLQYGVVSWGLVTRDASGRSQACVRLGFAAWKIPNP